MQSPAELLDFLPVRFSLLLPLERLTLEIPFQLVQFSFAQDDLGQPRLDFIITTIGPHLDVAALLS